MPDSHLDEDGRLLEGPDALLAGQLLDVLAGDAEDLVARPETAGPTGLGPGRRRTLGTTLKSD